MQSVKGDTSAAPTLNAALLGRSAPVVRKRGHIFDPRYFQSRVLEIEHRLLAPGAGTFDLDFHFKQSVLARRLSGMLGRATRGERRALASALEATRPRRCPRQRLAIEIG